MPLTKPIKPPLPIDTSSHVGGPNSRPILSSTPFSDRGEDPSTDNNRMCKVADCGHLTLTAFCKSVITQTLRFLSNSLRTLMLMERHKSVFLYLPEKPNKTEKKRLPRVERGEREEVGENNGVRQDPFVPSFLSVPFLHSEGVSKEGGR